MEVHFVTLDSFYVKNIMVLNYNARTARLYPSLNFFERKSVCDYIVGKFKIPRDTLFHADTEASSSVVDCDMRIYSKGTHKSVTNRFNLWGMVHAQHNVQVSGFISMTIQVAIPMDKTSRLHAYYSMHKIVMLPQEYTIRSPYGIVELNEMHVCVDQNKCDCELALIFSEVS